MDVSTHERMLRPALWQYFLVSALSSSLVLGQDPAPTPATATSSGAAGNVADGMVAQLMNSECDKAIAAFGVESRKAQAPCRWEWLSGMRANTLSTHPITLYPHQSYAVEALSIDHAATAALCRSVHAMPYDACRMPPCTAMPTVKPRLPRSPKHLPRMPMPMIGLQLARPAPTTRLCALA